MTRKDYILLAEVLRVTRNNLTIDLQSIITVAGALTVPQLITEYAEKHKYVLGQIAGVDLVTEELIDSLSRGNRTFNPDHFRDVVMMRKGLESRPGKRGKGEREVTVGRPIPAGDGAISCCHALFAGVEDFRLHRRLVHNEKVGEEKEVVGSEDDTLPKRAREYDPNHAEYKASNHITEGEDLSLFEAIPAGVMTLCFGLKLGGGGAVLRGQKGFKTLEGLRDYVRRTVMLTRTQYLELLRGVQVEVNGKWYRLDGFDVKAVIKHAGTLEETWGK